MVYVVGSWGVFAINPSNGEFVKKSTHNLDRCRDICVIGDMAYAVCNDGVFTINMTNNCEVKLLKEDNWSATRAVVAYKGDIVAFLASGIWFISPETGEHKRASESNWGSTLPQCAMMINGMCYTHNTTGVWATNLSTCKWIHVSKANWKETIRVCSLDANF